MATERESVKITRDYSVPPLSQLSDYWSFYLAEVINSEKDLHRAPPELEIKNVQSPDSFVGFVSLKIF